VQHSHAETHRHLADIVNHDPKTRVGIFASVSNWMLGYPDRALRLSDEAQAHARRRGHPFDFGWALSMGALEPNHHCKLQKLLKRAEECEWLGRENSLALLWEGMAPMSYGLALIQKGKPAKGIGPLKAAMAFWEATGGKNNTPTLKALLAEAMALSGDLDNALVLIDEVIAQVERPAGGTPLRQNPAPRGLDALAQGRL
jgi:hypothetical protein